MLYFALYFSVLSIM